MKNCNENGETRLKYFKEKLLRAKKKIISI